MANVLLIVIGPIEWMRKCVETLDPNSYHRSQILLGLNFYGYDYSNIVTTIKTPANHL